MEQRKKQKIYASKAMLICRIAVGAYLVYLSYGLVGDLSKKSEEVSRAGYIGFMAVGLIFAVVGIAFVFFSIKALRNGEYAGGAADESVPVTEEIKEEKKERITFDEDEIPEIDLDGEEEEETDLDEGKVSEVDSEENEIPEIVSDKEELKAEE